MREIGTIKRLIEEGTQLLTNCKQLEMKAADGKNRLTDVANIEQLLRIIQSIPSSKAEPFKMWLAQVGRERIDETIDPVSIIEKEALVAKKDGIVVGALVFSADNNEIAFLAVHPEYRKMGIAQNLIKKMLSLFPTETQISVITYREDDWQGLAARKLYLNFGFECGELLTIFEYPCQRLIYIV